MFSRKAEAVEPCWNLLETETQSSVVGNYNLFLLGVIPVNCLASSHTHANGPSWTSSEGFLSKTINRYQRDMFKTEFVIGTERPPTLNELNTDIYIPQRKDCIEGNWESSSSFFLCSFQQVEKTTVKILPGCSLPVRSWWNSIAYRYIYQRP